MKQGVDLAVLRDRYARLVRTARQAGLLLVWVVPGADMVSRYQPYPSNAFEPDAGAGKPAATEPLVYKAEIGAFASTGLDRILRDNGVTHVVLAGVSTGHAVAFTAREAVALGYEVTVLEDACADLTLDGHTAAIEALAETATITSMNSGWTA